MAFASAGFARGARARRRTCMCARRGDDEAQASPRGQPATGDAPAAAGGALLADLVDSVTRALNPRHGIETPASHEDLHRASAARDAARKARDAAADGVHAARARLEAAEAQLAALLPDVAERERRVELARGGEPAGAADVEALLDGARAGVDGAVAQCAAARARRAEAEDALAGNRREVDRLRDVAAASEVGDSLRALQQARRRLDALEDGAREKRAVADRVTSELREVRRALDGIKADIAAVEAHLPAARVAADGAREQVRRRDRESCRALDLLVDELEKATEESAAVLRLAEANLDRSVVKQMEASKNVFAARIRRAEAVMRTIVAAKERREQAVNEVLQECE